MPGGAIVNQWATGFSRVSTFQVPSPSVQSAGVNVANSAGNWLVAIVSWRQDAGLAGLITYPTTVSVSDDAHNYWIPAKASAANTGVIRQAVWFAPGARAANWVFSSTSGYQPGSTMLVTEITGTVPWASVSVSAVAATNQGTSVSVTLPSPPAGLLAIAAISYDNSSTTFTPTATGWTALSTVNTINFTDQTGTMVQAAWAGTTGTAANTVSATSSVTCDMAGIVVCIHGAIDTQAAPVQPNPGWPILIAEMGYGSYLETEPDLIAWTDISARLNNDAHIKVARGIQYNQQSLEAGSFSGSFDNFDGAFTPGNTASPFTPYQGDADIPFRLRAIWPGGTWQVQFQGNGSTSFPQIDTGQVFNVTPGLSYQASAYLSCTPAYAAGMIVIINWFTSGSVLLGSTSSNIVSGIASVLAIAIGVAPATAAKASILIQAIGTPASTVVFRAAAATSGPGFLVIPPAISWTGENGATRTTLASFTPSRSGPPNATPYYPLFNGFTDKSVVAWDSIYRGFATLTAMDAWARLTTQMLTAAAEEVLSDHPTNYWPLTDVTGASSAHDLVPGSVDTMVPVTSKNGAQGAVAAFGGTTIALQGDPSATCWTVSGMAAGAAAATGGISLAYLPANPAVLPSLTTGVTFEFWASLGGAAQPGVTTTNLVVAGCYGPKGPLWQILVNGPGGGAQGQPVMATYDKVTGASTLTNLAAFDFFTGSSNQLFAVEFTTTTWTVYIDGGGTAKVSGTANFPTTYNGFVLNGQNGVPNLSGLSLNASFYGVALYPSLLPPSRAVTHYFIPTFAETNGGEDDSDRTRRVIGYGGYIPVLAARGTELETLPHDDLPTDVTGITDTYNQVTSAYVTNMAQSTLAGMFVSGDGALCYRRREEWYNRAIALWTLGEQPFNGETTYEPDGINLSTDRTLLYNTTVITQSGSGTVPSYVGGSTVGTSPSSGVVVQTQNLTSVGKRSSVPYTATSYLNNTAAANPYNPAEASIEDFSNWIVNTQGNPVLRAPAVVIAPARNSNAWLMALGAEVGDSATLNRRPMDGIVTSVPAWISRVEHDICWGENVWDTSYQLSPFPQGSVLQLDSPGNGVLDGTNVIGW